MGAETFSQLAYGRTAAEAFTAAQEQARYDYGHAGYTGTIAEKSSFQMANVPAERLAELQAADHPYYDYDSQDPNWEQFDDKWGPAGCINLGPKEPGKLHKFLFFGWASS
jgi:hypothetical protein